MYCRAHGRSHTRRWWFTSGWSCFSSLQINLHHMPCRWNAKDTYATGRAVRALMQSCCLHVTGDGCTGTKCADAQWATCSTAGFKCYRISQYYWQCADKQPPVRANPPSPPC